MISLRVRQTLFVSVLPFALFSVMAACDSAPARSPNNVFATSSLSSANENATAETTTTSAASPSATTGSSTHTVDAAGFVDNGGRTDDEESRTEMGGMRATETGSERPTGTPGAGIPLPIEPHPKKVVSANAEKMPRPRASATEAEHSAGAPSSSIIGRVVEAMCDREMGCDRVGANKTWKTAASCMDSFRSHALDEMDAAACPDGVDATAVATCLTGLRRAECRVKIDGLSSSQLTECDPSSLCLKR